MISIWATDILDVLVRTTKEQAADEDNYGKTRVGMCTDQRDQT